VVVAIVGVLASLAIPSFQAFTKIVQFVSCKTEIRLFEREISSYLMEKGELPDTLSDIGRENEEDPWGNTYEYIKISLHPGDERTDIFAVALNDDYDLYSKGPDGLSNQSTTHASSLDDVIRGGNGHVVDTGAEF